MMKQNVKLSTYSVVLSAVCMIIMLVCLYYCRTSLGIYSIGAVIIAWMLLVLYYMPMTISVDDTFLNIRRPFRAKSIPLSDIHSVKLCPPTMAERKLLGSGGFFGYWGRFSEPSVGRYFAYYGKASDCFLVRLKDGKKYMLGCENAPAVVRHIASRLN